jgi:hypothetical protein
MKRPTKDQQEKPRSEQQRRLQLIERLMRDQGNKGNPRDYLIVTQGRQIMDVSGVYDVRAELPEVLEPGNHVWTRSSNEGKEVVELAIVVQDRAQLDGYDGPVVLVRDEPRTREWPILRAELSPLPFTMAPMLIHKRSLRKYLGDRWGEVFWDESMRHRRARPALRRLMRVV